MVSGKEKAMALIALLGPKAGEVLKHLEPDQADLLKANIDNVPTDPNVVQDLVSEAMEKLNALQKSGESVQKEESAFEGAFSDELSLEEEASFDKEAQGVDQEFAFEEDEGARIKDQEQVVSEEEGMEKPSTDQKQKEEEEIVAVDYKKIAENLAQERPQLVAFMLAKMEDEKKDKLLDYLPSGVLKRANEKDVEFAEISDKIYKGLAEELFKVN